MEREELLLSITRCPELAAARNDARHPCRRVVCFQGADDYHVPEPWQGHIETAPILFISLNPGYGADAVFPTPAWDDTKTVDFFQRRFDPEAGWTSRLGGSGIYLRRYDSSGNEGFTGRHVQHWSVINGYARELLGREPVFGRDIAMTMAVHCKSGESSVAKSAMRLCPQKWLPRVIKHSPARLVVALGNDARDACADLWVLDKNQRVQFGVTINERERAVIYLPHPAARVSKRVGDYIDAEQLRQLRALLAEG